MVLTIDETTNGTIPGYWETEEAKDEAPTLDYMLSLFQEYRRYYNPFHQQCMLEEDYYNGRRNVPAPDGIDAVWPASAAGIVNVATDHVDVNNLSIDVPSSPRNRDRAERLKKFYQGAWMNIKKPVLRTAVKQSFLYGIAFIKTMFAAERWPDAPAMNEFDDPTDYKQALMDFMDLRCITWPIEVNVVQPTNIIWDDSKARMKWCMEFYNRPTRDLKYRYPEWVSLSDSGQGGMTEWIEYWDEEWCCYIADKQIVWGPFKHGYGFLPYSPIIPANSFTFEDRAPQDRYKGILHPAHNQLDEEARLITQIGAIVRTTAYRTLDFQGPRAQTEEAADNYELFGGKNVLPAGVSVQASPLVNVPPDIGNQLARIQSYIEQVTFPNVIRGVRPRGVSAGFGISVLAGMGRLVFQGTADGLRHSIEQVNSNFARLVENKVRGRITVHARTEVHNFDQAITPDDIRGMYENTVVVKAEAPEEREREALLAMRLQGAGIISVYEAMRRAGIVNPLEEMNQIRAEELLKSPEFLAAQAGLLMQEVGLGQQLMGSISPTLDGAGGIGNMNLGGQQLQRPGEGMLQQGRVASMQGQPSVYPQGISGMDSLGSILGSPGGGAQGMPSGQTVR